MQIHSLYIDDYKILKNFNIEFNKDISILVGINGSGKSTILEAIAQIFSDAILNKKSKFGFKLVYSLRFEETVNKSTTWSESNVDYFLVELSAAKKDVEIAHKVYIRETIDTDKILEKKSDIEKEFSSFNKILPSNIVIYYSGLSEIMKDICQPHDKKLAEQYREGNITADRPFFYFEPALFDIILISLLSYEFGDIPQYLKDKTKIDGFQSITIRLKKPDWAKEKLDNWWGARGEVKDFLNFLDKIGTPLVVNDDDEQHKGRRGNVVMEAFQNEFLIITIIGQEKLFEIREYFTEEKALFKMLNTLYIDDFWADATFNFVKRENDDRSSFSILSEGEQQSVIVKGLTELVTSENTLFLFDEPDTYLHPLWQRNFIKEIVEFNENSYNISSHFLITTHSPQLLSDADSSKTEVKIMEEGNIVKITPKYYGKDICTILYELMGGVEKRNEIITKSISELFNSIEDENLDEAKQKYNDLSSLLGEDDPDIVQAKIQIDYLEEEQK
ncbi:hypothetical protein FACS189411_07530 [Bacteroidia bacterium]|nr:hypothetical protein FACS189411_07530 [Bacteroidia bacterium]